MALASNEYDPTPDETSGGPVTSIISRSIKSGRQNEGAYEHWLDGISQAATTFPGFVGTNIMRRSSEAGLEYVVILRFDRYQCLAGWEASQMHKDWIDKIPHHAVAGEANVRKIAGLELWFKASSPASPDRPARYKMAMILIVLVFTMLNLLTPIFAWLFGTMEPHLRMLLVITTQVSLMTYLILPYLTKLLSPWLYAKPSFPPLAVTIDRIAWLAGIRNRRPR